MFRRILNYALLILVLSAIIWLAFRFFHKVGSQQNDIWEAVPESAAVIIRLEQPFPLWKKINDSNIVWEDIKHSKMFGQINQIGKKIDSLTKTNLPLAGLVYEQPCLISFHYSGKEKTDMLFVISAGENSTEEVIAILNSVSKTPAISRNFQGNQIYTIQFGVAYYATIKNGIVALSTSEQLAESVLLQQESGKNIRQLNGFSVMAQTLSQNADAGIYILHQNFTGLLARGLNKDLEKLLNENHPYALFSGMDVDVSSGTIALNGFSVTNDSLTSLLDVFSDQEPQEFEAAKILPNNTAAFLWLGINDGNSFETAIENYLGKKNRLVRHQEKINAFNSEFDCNIRQSILSWMGSEIVLFTTADNKTTDLNTHLFLAMRINDLQAPIDELNDFSARLDSVNSEPTLLTGGIEIRQLKHNDIFSSLFGDLFSGIKQPYYLRVDDYIIFANSPHYLEKYLFDIANDRSLGKNITYYNFVSDNLSDRANLTVYANPSAISSVYQSFINEQALAGFSATEELLKKFDAFAWQMSRNDLHKYYNNIYLKYNSGGRQDSRSLWEVSLDTTALTVPMLIHNHMTNTENIVIQDMNYMLYLISNKGNVIWKKQLEEKLLGNIREIDYFGNGKLQLAFCTQTQLHLLDLKNNYLKNYPVNLHSDVSATPGVFDYENNNNYRFVVPVGKQLLNIDKEGKKTEGWEFEGTRNIITQTPMFFRCDNKDYIFVTDKTGEIYILDRKGKSRYSVNVTLDKLSPNTVILNPGQSIENTSIVFSDSLGQIIRFYFNGSSDTARTGRLSPLHRFSMIDVNNDKEKDLIILDSNKISIKTWTGKYLGGYEFTDQVAMEFDVFKMKDGTVRIGLHAPGSGEIYLLMNDGSLHPKFPVEGFSAFTLMDINGDGTQEIITATNGRRIICYSFN